MAVGVQDLHDSSCLRVKCVRVKEGQVWLFAWLVDVRVQEQLQAERQAAKAAAAQQSVRDKTTFASRQQALFTDNTVKAAFHDTLKASKKVWSSFAAACLIPDP